MRNLTFREALMAFSMLLVLSLLQAYLGIDGAVSFLVGILAAAIASFFGIRIVDDRAHSSDKGYFKWIPYDKEG